MHSDFLHKRHSSLTDRSKGPIPSQMINQEKTCCTLQRAVGRRADIYGAFYLFKTSEDRLIVKASYVAVAFLSLYILKCFDTCFLAGKFAVVFFFSLFFFLFCRVSSTALRVSVLMAIACRVSPYAAANAHTRFRSQETYLPIIVIVHLAVSASDVSHPPGGK